MLKVIFIRIPLISGIFYDMLITDDNAIPPFVNLANISCWWVAIMEMMLWQRTKGRKHKFYSVNHARQWYRIFISHSFRIRT